MENFKEWLDTQEMALGNVARAVGRAAMDQVFGPETGVNPQQAASAASGVVTAAQMAAYKAKQMWNRRRCQMGNLQSCMTSCTHYRDQDACMRVNTSKNVMGQQQ